MKWLLVLCALVAISQIGYARPNKEQDEYDNILNDDGTEDDYTSDPEPEDAGEDEEPPEIRTKPKTITVAVGETVELPCKTENADMYSIMWNKDNVMLYQDKLPIGQKNPRISRLDNQTLQIVQVQAEDAGKYICSISTDPLTSVAHVLNVRHAPKVRIVPKGGSVHVHVGDELKLNCIGDGVPKPKIVWSKAGTRLHTVEETYEGALITITNVDRDTAGYYQCMADNSIGKPAVDGIHVQVHYAPIVKLRKVIINTNEVWLECKVHAYPKAEVKWFKHNETVQASPNLVIETNTHNHHEHFLKFKQIDGSDFGDYNCRAYNKYGVQEKHLKLMGKPTTPVFSESEYSVNENEATVKWTFESIVPITQCEMRYREVGHSEWIFEKIDVQNQNDASHIYGATYKIENLKPVNYEVQLRSKNKHGWSQYSEIKTITHAREHEADVPPLVAMSNPEEHEPDVPSTILDVGHPEESTNSATVRIPATLTVLFAIFLSLCSTFV